MRTTHVHMFILFGEEIIFISAFEDLTSACFLANSEPSAFRLWMMPSILLELNSLREEENMGSGSRAGYLLSTEIRRFLQKSQSVWCWSTLLSAFLCMHVLNYCIPLHIKATVETNWNIVKPFVRLLITLPAGMRQTQWGPTQWVHTRYNQCSWSGG